MKAFLLFITLAPIASALASVTTYFNHNQNNQYTEPYRGITRKGDNLEDVILKEINGAKKSIFVAVQELRLPLVAQALVDKKNAGVDVRVVLEHDYNFNILRQTDVSTDTQNQHDASKLTELRAFVDMNRDGKIDQNELMARDAIYILQRAGVTILDDTSNLSAGSGLMHHKFVIVDKKTTIVSSANFTMSCIHGDVLAPNSRGNANSMIVVKSVAFAEVFNDEFQQLWGNGKRGNFGQGKTYRGPRSITVAGTKLTVQFSPTSRRFNWEESVNGLIGQTLSKAQKSVNAALFVYSDQNLSNILERRSDAGAKMGFLVEPKFAYREYSELLDMFGVSMLSPKCSYQAENRPWRTPVYNGGIPRLPVGDVLHHKFAVVDGKTVIMGSQNWSDSANYSNDEVVVVMENSSISDLYTQEYQRLARGAVLGVPAWLRAEIGRKETDCANQGFHY